MSSGGDIPETEPQQGFSRDQNYSRKYHDEVYNPEDYVLIGELNKDILFSIPPASRIFPDFHYIRWVSVLTLMEGDFVRMIGKKSGPFVVRSIDEENEIYHLFTQGGEDLGRQPASNLIPCDDYKSKLNHTNIPQIYKYIRSRPKFASISEIDFIKGFAYVFDMEIDYIFKNIDSGFQKKILREFNIDENILDQKE